VEKEIVKERIIKIAKLHKEICDKKQKEFLESFGFNPNNMTIYQVFVTINWLKKKNPTTELVNKLKAKLEGRNPTKPVGA